LVVTAIDRSRWFDPDDIEPLQLIAEWRANIDKAADA
jgi:hypothetical protein